MPLDRSTLGVFCMRPSEPLGDAFVPPSIAPSGSPQAQENGQHRRSTPLSNVSVRSRSAAQMVLRGMFQWSARRLDRNRLDGSHFRSRPEHS